MRNFAAKLSMVLVALTVTLPQPIAAQEVDANRVAMEEELVTAVACRKEFGEVWDSVVSDSMSNLTDYLSGDIDEPLAKYELDVVLIDLQADGEKLPMTDELRAHCEQAIAYGS